MDDVLAVVTDLFFQSRVLAAAKASGRSLRFESRPEVLQAARGWRVALVDLDAQTDVMGAITALARSRSGTVVAFGPHLDTDKRKAARRAGADRVLAKSKFVTELPHIMNETTGASSDLAHLAEYGRRMVQLGQMLQDPGQVRRIYFAPATNMEDAEAHGDPIVLDAADYLPFLAVESLRPIFDRVRAYGDPAAE